MPSVQPEADSTVSLTAVKVIDKQDLYLLSSIPFTDLVHQRRQSDRTSVQPHRCTRRYRDGVTAPTHLAGTRSGLKARLRRLADVPRLLSRRFCFLVLVGQSNGCPVKQGEKPGE